MSPEQSNSPAPGSGPDRPLWIREDHGAAAHAAAAFDLALKIVTAAYLLMAAWQVAKILSPGLQVRQDVVIAAARRRLARRRESGAELGAELPELGALDRRPIYDDTR
jgi:hypothetical protein